MVVSVAVTLLAAPPALVAAFHVGQVYPEIRERLGDEPMSDRERVAALVPPLLAAAGEALAATLFVMALVFSFVCAAVGVLLVALGVL